MQQHWETPSTLSCSTTASKDLKKTLSLVFLLRNLTSIQLNITINIHHQMARFLTLPFVLLIKSRIFHSGTQSRHRKHSTISGITVTTLLVYLTLHSICCHRKPRPGWNENLCLAVEHTVQHCGVPYNTWSSTESSQTNPLLKSMLFY